MIRESLENGEKWVCADCPVCLEKRASRDCKGLPEPLERTGSEAVPAKRDPPAASDPQVNLVSPALKGHPDCRGILVRRVDPGQRVIWAARERTAWMAKLAHLDLLDNGAKQEKTVCQGPPASLVKRVRPGNLEPLECPGTKDLRARLETRDCQGQRVREVGLDQPGRLALWESQVRAERGAQPVR